MHLPPMRPELELILRCARNWPDEAADTRIAELLAGPIDWEFLLRIAERHRMKPFLYWNLKDRFAESVPSPVWEQLQARFMANARGNMLSMGRMLRLLAQFDETGIPVMAFKGPVSTYHLYGIPGLREFTDLDLIVDPNDVIASTRLLVSHGFRPQELLSDRQTRALVRFRNEMLFSSPGLPFHVDLHWKLLYSCFDAEADSRRLMERAVEVAVGGRSIQSLAPADFFLYLGMRAAIDCWSSIYRLVDLAAAMRTMKASDMHTAIARATAVGKGRAVGVGLTIVQEFLGLGAPELAFFGGASDPEIRRLSNKAVHQVVAQPTFEPGLIASRLIGVRALQRPRDKACILLWLPLSPGPSDIKLARLPDTLFPLYRVVRAIRAPLKLARCVVQRAWSSRASTVP